LIIEIIAVTLLIFLITRELAGVANSEGAQRVASFLIVPIIPMLILFIVLVVLKAIEIAS
jgi:hypothetical protein